VGEAADFSFPALSPDDKKMAVAIRDPEIKTRDIWGVDLIGGTRTQLTFNPSDDLDPSGRRTEHGLPSPPTGRDKGQSIRDWRTGRGRRSWCSTGRTDKKTPRASHTTVSIFCTTPRVPRPLPRPIYVPLAGDRKPIPLVNTEFDTSGGRFSPNDRWLAFRSTETNKLEVYVQGFTLDPSQSRGKWQISTGEEESTPDGAATGKSCSTALVAPSSQWT
jgi:Tol biopolymer transport system component